MSKPEGLTIGAIGRLVNRWERRAEFHERFRLSEGVSPAAQRYHEGRASALRSCIDEIRCENRILRQQAGPAAER